MSSARSVDGAVRAATICAFAMIANQIAGKAVRDALFLSAFGIESLPTMIIVASLVTIIAVFLASRTLTLAGPARLVPAAFLGSAAVLLGLWRVEILSPKAAAVGLYIQMAAFGAVLISWFWSVLNERFDPNTARKRIGGIAGGGTLGGLIGGLVAERVGASLPMSAMFPVLASLHLVCGALMLGISRGMPAPGKAVEKGRSGLEVLRETPYLRDLALLVMTGTISGTFLDFVFKQRATAIFSGEELLRFFGMFYTAVATATFLLQAFVTRRALSAGLAPAISVLPTLVGLGGIVGLLVPGLASAAAARGVEGSIRSSIFRSAYELLYNPVRREDKRAAKTIVDVGFDRLGDMIGGGLIHLALVTAKAGASSLLLGGAATFAMVGLGLARRLHAGYVHALETSLLDRAESLEIRPEKHATDAFLQTVTHLELSGPLPDLGEAEPGDPVGAPTAPVYDTGPEDAGPEDTGPAGAGAAGAGAGGAADPVLRTAIEFRSGDAPRVRTALQVAPLPGELVPMIVPLLGWDEVASEAVRALRTVADRHVGQLTDALLDPDQVFAIRRRIPRILARVTDARAVAALVAALGDKRFEVRYQAGVALSGIHERRPDLAVDQEAVLAAISREARVDRRVWEGHRLLDEATADDTSPFYDDLVRRRASRSLEHVFTVLSLALPREPLRVAYRGLHASDPLLRGTALEYLQQVLPPDIRDALWPFLAGDRPADAKARDVNMVVDDLLRSHESIRVDLKKLREQSDERPPEQD